MAHTHHNISYSIDGGPNYFIDINTPLIKFYEPKYTFPGVYEFWNTISNVPYIIAGLQLLRRRSPISIHLIAVGVFSAMFHGTGHFIWEVMDELSILLLIHTILFEFHLRADLWVAFPFILYFIGIYLFNSFMSFYVILSVLSLISIYLLRDKARLRRKPELFNDMITCFAVGKLFWFLEQMGIWWFGHSIWHMFSALSLGYAGLIIDL